MTASANTDDEHRIPDAVETLRTAVRGPVLLPDDDEYHEARTVWNGMIDKRPAVVVQCTGTADVVAAVNAARESDMELSVHGGGHNVAGTAVTDGGLMVDLTPMNGVHVDRAAGTVRAEGGALLGDVDHETQLFGLATPLGAVSETGIAGLTLNGGYGHLSREYGLACDSLVSADVVTADGQVLTASTESHPDLFWAIRGGGGNFGVVTSFEYDLHEVGPEVYGLFTWFHGDDAEAALAGFREWTGDAPREAGALAFTAHVPELAEFPEASWGDPSVAFIGSYRGDPADADEVFESLTERAEPLADLSGPMQFEALQSMLDEDYPDGMRYYWKSTFVTGLPDELLDVLVRYNERAPSALSTVDVWHLGGAVAAVPQDATAFWHRDKPYMVNFEANWTDPDDDEANLAWAREGLAAVEELDVAGGRYGNFPGFEEDPVSLQFGGNYERLVDVKTEYDPENLFHHNRNVEPR
ncbi:FAD-binding oxidoreductase [Halorarius halobius]|uniref:FAD-binding oxidoreductase n=1 Tax=Halorarius halobius TaxID=2962671 RepID=UPI0020CD8D72|nr:FAD-binding oxidoreductase [Halorarius halobius]